MTVLVRMSFVHRRSSAFIGGFLLLLLFVPGSASPQTKRPRPAVPPAQEYRIDVGGHKLHIACRGVGKPPVIIEAGLGRSGAEWESVQVALASTTRVCVYDRAGLGQSDTPASGRRSAQLMVTELRVLLSRARVLGPFVLVGHSFGGLLVRLFASRYPLDTIGMVLVDSAHEDEIARFREILTPEQREQPENSMRPSLSMTGAEAVDLDASFVAVHERKWRADIPLVVLARGTPLSAADVPPGWSAEQLARGEAVRRELQQELASRSRQGKTVFVEGAGHFIHMDKPAAVIAAIREVVTSARK